MSTKVITVGGLAFKAVITNAVEVSELVVAGCVAMAVVERR